MIESMESPLLETVHTLNLSTPQLRLLKAMSDNDDRLPGDLAWSSRQPEEILRRRGLVSTRPRNDMDKHVRASEYPLAMLSHSEWWRGECAAFLTARGVCLTAALWGEKGIRRRLENAHKRPQEVLDWFDTIIASMEKQQAAQEAREEEAAQWLVDYWDGWRERLFATAPADESS